MHLFFSGDIAFRFLNYVRSRSDFTSQTSTEQSADVNEDKSSQISGRSRDCHVTVCDINQSMLEVGMNRATQSGITSGVKIEQNQTDTTVKQIFFIEPMSVIALLRP